MIEPHIESKNPQSTAIFLEEGSSWSWIHRCLRELFISLEYGLHDVVYMVLHFPTWSTGHTQRVQNGLDGQSSPGCH